MNYDFNYLIIANLDGSIIFHPLEIESCDNIVAADFSEIYQHGPF